MFDTACVPFKNCVNWRSCSTLWCLSRDTTKACYFIVKRSLTGSGWTPWKVSHIKVGQGFILAKYSILILNWDFVLYYLQSNKQIMGIFNCIALFSPVPSCFCKLLQFWNPTRILSSHKDNFLIYWAAAQWQNRCHGNFHWELQGFNVG